MNDVLEKNRGCIFSLFFLLILIAAFFLMNTEFGEPFGIQIPSGTNLEELDSIDILIYDTIPSSWRKQNGSPAQYEMSFSRSFYEIHHCEYESSSYQAFFYRTDLTVKLENRQTNEILEKIFQGSMLFSIVCPDANTMDRRTSNWINTGESVNTPIIETWLIEQLANDPILPSLTSGDVTREGLFILAARFGVGQYIRGIPEDWQVEALERPRYLLILEIDETIVEICKYNIVHQEFQVVLVQSPHDIERQQQVLSAELLDLQTNKLIAKYELLGDRPDECPEEVGLGDSTNRIRGGHPNVSEFRDWFNETTNELETLIPASSEEE